MPTGIAPACVARASRRSPIRRLAHACTPARAERLTSRSACGHRERHSPRRIWSSRLDAHLAVRGGLRDLRAPRAARVRAAALVARAPVRPRRGAPDIASHLAAARRLRALRARCARPRMLAAVLEQLTETLLLPLPARRTAAGEARRLPAVRVPVALALAQQAVRSRHCAGSAHARAAARPYCSRRSSTCASVSCAATCRRRSSTRCCSRARSRSHVERLRVRATQSAPVPRTIRVGAPASRPPGPARRRTAAARSARGR